MYRVWSGFEFDRDSTSAAGGVSSRRTLLIAAGALALLMLAGCGGAGGPETAPGASTESFTESQSEDFTFPAEAAALQLAITSLQPGSDATMLYYTVNFTGAPSRIQLFLDTDRNASTGYPINGIGASHLVEIGTGYRNLYSYSGSGGAWAWTLVKTVTYTKTAQSVKVTLAKTDVGSPNGIDVIAGLANSSATVYSAKVSHVLGSGADTAAPSVPAGLIGAAVSGSQINLSWNASTDNVGVTGYTVFLNDAQLATTTATSFSHTGLTAGTTYNYRVSAFDAVPNHSAWTATPVAVTTPAAPDTAAPSVPAGLIGAAVSGSQINLSWSASADNVGVTGYIVYLNDAQLATTTTTSLSHTGLTAGTTYNYRVSAFDAVPNHSAWTATPVAVTTPAAPDTAAPSVPAGLIGAAVSGSQINLSWSASADNVGVTGYIVYLNDAQLATTTTTSLSHTGLTAGTTYNYRVSAFDAVPNHSAWTATPVAVTTPGSGPSTVTFSCSFPTAPTDCGFKVQEKVPGRASIVGIGRDGGTGVRLHTEPGDNNVAGSGDMERTDLYLAHAGGAPIVFNQGEEQWWSFSIMFPNDFVFPTWQRYALSGFHHTGPTGQGNMTLGFERGALDTDPGVLGFQGYGGTQDGGPFGAAFGPVQKNVWYDVVYQIRWSSGSDGIFDAWVNGVKKLTHRGPTLYAGQGAYFKLANYHTPICDPYPACVGTHPASSVIYDRVVRGTTPLAVSLGPLEGVLTLVNGVLTLVQ